MYYVSSKRCPSWCSGADSSAAGVIPVQLRNLDDSFSPQRTIDTRRTTQRAEAVGKADLLALCPRAMRHDACHPFVPFVGIAHTKPSSDAHDNSGRRPSYLSVLGWCPNSRTFAELITSPVNLMSTTALPIGCEALNETPDQM